MTAAPSDLEAGDAVEMHSLVGRPELNGRIGTITSYDAKKGRFAVIMRARPRSSCEKASESK